MEFCYTAPAWLEFKTIQLQDVRSQMQFVIDLSRRNVEHETGGPFAAAVFTHYGRLHGVGVNRVMPENCSILHAEVMALMSAHQTSSDWDLSGGLRLVTSCQPCCMCFGAILWSGISVMVYGANADDARSVGFDEGPLVEDWASQMRQRSIQVIGPVLREEAVAVLDQYAEQGTIYNPGTP